MEEIDLSYYLATAEVVLGIPGEQLRRAAGVSRAESALAAPHAGFGGLAFYPDPAQRAAILCSRLVRNHPLPDGNKRTAFLCMLGALELAGLALDTSDEDAVADVIEALAAGDLSEGDFVAWVQERTTLLSAP